MDFGVPVDAQTRQAWIEIAHAARLADRMLRRVGDPEPRSPFAQVNALYRWEKASDWHRAYAAAALEHLVLWADIVSPLRFDPEQVVQHSLRPAYTLGRAAMEAASQAVWMTATAEARECARRHVALILWDYDEQRKSLADLDAKARVSDQRATVVERSSGLSADAPLPNPNHLMVLRGAAPEIACDPADIDRMWRAASGAAHGKYWPSLALSEVTPVAEYEPGHFRALRIPDPAGMTEVLRTAGTMATFAVYRHAELCGADLASLAAEAMAWLKSVVPQDGGKPPADGPE